MLRLWQRVLKLLKPDPVDAGLGNFRYRAFLSYRTADQIIAERLQRKLEGYRVPRSLVGTAGEFGPVPPIVGRIFRDREESRTAEDIETIIAQELSKSEQLIVLCTPRAVEPAAWVGREIDIFRERRPDGHIQAVIGDGEPPGCFPKQLLGLTAEGRLRQPLAADLRPIKSGGQDGEARAIVKVIASLIGVSFDDLWRRERRRARQQLAAVAAGVLLLGTLAGAAGLSMYSRSEKLSHIAREELMDALVNEGSRNVSTDPATSLRLALIAHQILPNLRPITLAHDALKQVPPWLRIAPPAIGPASAVFLIPHISSTDIFAVDHDAASVLVHENRQPGESTGSLGATIGFHRVADGERLAVLQLEADEEFVTPRHETTSLFSTRSPRGRKIYRMAADGMARPLIETGNGVMDLAFTRGDFPVHLLLANGALASYENKDAQPSLVATGRADGTIHAHPSGKSLVILRADGIAFFERAAGGAWALVKEISWPKLPPLDTGEIYGDRTQLAWGPSPWHLIIATLEGKQSRLFALDLRRGKKQRAYEAAYETRGIDRWLMKADAEGRRAVIAVDKSDRGSVVQVVDLDWIDNDSADAVVKATVKEKGNLAGQLPLEKISNVAAATIAPNRNFAVIVSFQKDGSAGSAKDGVGVIESWDLSRLNRPGEMTVQNCGGGQSEEGEHVQVRVLQPEPVFEYDNAVGFGTVPINRVSYSRDSSRLVAMDSRGAYYVFRVRQSHGYDRMPESWAERNCLAEIRSAGDHGRYLIVKFGDGEFRIYDLLTKHETRISALVGAKVLHVAMTSSGDVFALTGRDIKHLQGDKILDSRALPISISSLEVDSDIVTGFGTDGAVMLDASTLGVLGTLTGDAAAAFVQTMRADYVFDKGLASLAQSADKQSGPSRMVFMDHDDKVKIWSMKKSADLSIEVKDTNVSFSVAPPKRSFISLRRLPDPDVLIVNYGNYRSRTAEIRQYETATGRELKLYEPPSDGWPGQIVEVEDARIVGDRALILFRYWLDGESGDRYAVGYWPKGGGPCQRWVELGPLENNPIYLQTVAGEDLVHGLFWTDSRHDAAALVRFSDGAVLWRGPVAYPAGPAPHLTKGSPWKTADGEFYLHAALDIKLGGYDYWENATQIQLPESVIARIDRIAPGVRQATRH